MRNKMIRTALDAAMVIGTMLGTVRIAVAVAVISFAATVHAGVLMVAGSPGYDPAPDAQTGLKDGTMFIAAGWSVTNSGTAVAQSMSYINNVNMGARAVRWDYTGTAAELGTLGTDGTGVTSAAATAINNAGTAVGISNKYDGSSGSLGTRAVRWGDSGVATELAPLSLTNTGVTTAEAWSVNAGGKAVGSAAQYVGDTPMGTRPVRWDADGTITPLGNLGLYNGFTLGVALAINDADTAVGWVQKTGTGGISAGKRAVRWDALGAIKELDNLGINSTMFSKTDILAFAINAGGTAVGWAEKWSPNGKAYQGNRAVRWDGSGTAATELGTLGLSSIGRTSGIAYAVNDAGAAAGYSEKYDSGTLVGTRAVRWSALGGAATEFGNLGLDVNNSTNAIAYALNGAGTAVGYSQKYDGGIDKGSRAVIWLPDASAIDLNDLGMAPVADSGTWILTTAKALSADGWVAGSGTFDPDGGGPQAGYVRHWVTQVGLGGAWTKVEGGTWGRGPNWFTGTPAMQVGNATFNLSAAYIVALDRDELTKTIAIDAGTVTIDSKGHTLATESGLRVASGATLKSLGKLNITGSLASTGTLEFDIASLLSHDQIDLTGVFNAGGMITLKLDGYAPVSGDSFDLMNFSSFIDNGYAFDFTQAGLSAGLMWDTTSFATTGSIGVVPEPSTLALLGMGAIGLLGYAWQRRNA